MEKNKLGFHPRQEIEQDVETAKSDRYFVPLVNICESDSEVIVIVEMPGVPKDRVQIALEDNILTIRGTQQIEKVDDAKILLQEYESRNFFRRFTVLETIDQDAIRASINNGILKIVLPKAAPAQPRKIEITAE